MVDKHVLNCLGPADCRRFLHVLILERLGQQKQVYIIFTCLAGTCCPFWQRNALLTVSQSWDGIGYAKRTCSSLRTELVRNLRNCEAQIANQSEFVRVQISFASRKAIPISLKHVEIV